MQTRVTLEAQKQRKSRNLRADCNIDLILMSLLNGFEIKFSKSKMTTSAKKVYIGSISSIEGKEVSNQEVLTESLLFECIMRKYWNEKKMNYGEDLLLTKEKLETYKVLDEIQQSCRAKIPLLQSNKQTDSHLVLWGNNDHLDIDAIKGSNSLRKRKTKNKEAAFNNYMSNWLLAHGMQFTCQIIARKLTLRTLHLFVWKSYILPNGKVITSDMLQPLTSRLRNYIDSLQSTSKTVINRNTLVSLGITNALLEECGLDYYCDDSVDSQVHSSLPSSSMFIPQTCRSSLSAFSPCQPSSYWVINDSFESSTSFC